MKKTFVILASMMLSVPALAQWSGTLGLKQSTAACENCAGADNKAEMPFQIGALYNHDFATDWALRTGAVYSMRNYKFDSAGVEAKTALTFVDVPVTAKYQMNDTVGLFGGIIAGAKLSDKCEAAGVDVDCVDAKSLITPLTVGANFRFAEWGVELAYETDSAAYVKGLKDEAAIGINGLYHF